MKCNGFGQAYCPEMEDCKKCLIDAPIRSSKCKEAMKHLIRESCNTEPEIRKWLEENKNLPKRIGKSLEY